MFVIRFTSYCFRIFMHDFDTDLIRGFEEEEESEVEEDEDEDEEEESDGDDLAI